MSAEFVQRRGNQLWLDDNAFRIAGANIYSFAFGTQDDQKRLLDVAQSFDCNVLRIWAFLDRDLPADTDVCFQSFRPGATAPETREGPFGLARLDSAVKLAAARELRLILTLTNYHPDYGGMPQYQRWLNLASLNDFYSDASAKSAYQNWVETILTRYKNDPTVLAWEIANEPRCPGNTGLLTDWLKEMSSFIRERAPLQLIASGDEGFFARERAGNNWLFNGSQGVDAEAILGIPDIDFGTYHLYPDQWVQGEDPIAFGQMWIAEHLSAADRADKPMLLEEYGLPASVVRNDAYSAWLDVVQQQGGLGALVWMIGEAGQGDQYLLTAPDDAPPVLDFARLVGAGPIQE
jgi:mannan endo-1,4-beta-mannosidase